jgi:flavin-binding protein dodecin
VGSAFLLAGTTKERRESIEFDDQADRTGSYTDREKEETMAIAKVLEVLAEGDSIEAAIQSAVSEAAETVRGIKHVYVEGVQALVEDNEVVKYRVNAKLTFVVETDRD